MNYNEAMKNNKLYKLNIITAAIIVAVLLASTLIAVFIYMGLDFNKYDNAVRLLVSEQKDEIERGNYKKLKYPYIVFDLTGKVKYSQYPFDEKIGDEVNVQEMLQYDESFQKENQNKNRNDVKQGFVLKHKGSVVGFVVFLIPKSVLMKNTNRTLANKVFLPISIGLGISIFVLFVRTIYCNFYILKPLKEISKSAKGIIAGNYDLEVVRVYEKRIGENEVGELTFAFELMRDELKSKQVKEEALKKSQQELISCISHDLKTPISTIKAYSEALRDHIAKNPEAQEGFVKVIISKTDLLISMINELLEYSNAELKQLDINCQEIYFLDYFNPLMKEVEIFVKQNGLEFAYETSVNNMIVNIDTKRITEVIYNLIENSIKYMSDENKLNQKGKIAIEVEWKDKQVCICVKDNGIGIRPDDIPYVFDKFYRAEKSRSTSIPGSGLGLSICKYIVNEHGGEIYCKSRYKEGCEIGFTLK